MLAGPGHQIQHDEREVMASQQAYNKKPSVLDNLTENRAERLVVLLKNLPNEDL